MKRVIIVAVAIAVSLAVWLLSSCTLNGQIVETSTDLPGARSFTSGMTDSSRVSDEAALPKSATFEDGTDIPRDSSRGYIDIDQSGDFNEGDILLNSNGDNSYFLPQDYYSDTET